MEYRPIRVGDLIRDLNNDIYLPAIQREFVWNTDKVERLFDSIMSDFPIGSFLFWRLEEKHKDQWPIYEFIRNFDTESPHNTPANMAGITKDISLVLDGQQRITSLYIGLKGSYRYYYYGWKKTELYLNLLRQSKPNDDNPQELIYEFSFRENDKPNKKDHQHWYKVGRILDFEDAEDAKADMSQALANLSEEDRQNANKLIGRLHNRIHTSLVGNYYLEKSQDYDKVLQVFVRANSAGQQLEYSDLLLSTATAKWENLDARNEINDFTTALNANGFKFGKDFVLKACLFLTEDLPIQYRIKNFTKTNLLKIEANWDTIKDALSTTIRLISRFGFFEKNVVAPLALLPIAFFIMKRADYKFETSSDASDSQAQMDIRKWFIFSTLKGAFGGSSDTTLNKTREILANCNTTSPFPESELYKALGIEPKFNRDEIDRMLKLTYQGRYTKLVLSLLCAGSDWKNQALHEDHIFPQAEFKVRSLAGRGYDEAKIREYMSCYNTLPNLELLSPHDNTRKNASGFDKWFPQQDQHFKDRHLIPVVPDYSTDSFLTFFQERKKLMTNALAQF